MTRESSALNCKFNFNLRVILRWITSEWTNVKWFPSIRITFKQMLLNFYWMCCLYVSSWTYNQVTIFIIRSCSVYWWRIFNSVKSISISVDLVATKQSPRRGKTSHVKTLLMLFSDSMIFFNQQQRNRELTLYSSRKSFPSSADRTRYSSSRLSTGRGK